MLGFLERFLTFVRDVMAKVDDCTYVFEWKPEWEGVCFTFDPDQEKGVYFFVSFRLNYFQRYFSYPLGIEITLTLPR